MVWGLGGVGRVISLDLDEYLNIIFADHGDDDDDDCNQSLVVVDLNLDKMKDHETNDINCVENDRTA